ncbi:MAG: substrate-binding domain-containing protein [Oscillospiraceae bacterium]|nr:substrate-binding domain-containing protein [Oscillospiraceae bacterium]
MKTKIIGAGILVAVIVFVAVFVVMKQSEAETVTVTGYVGGEKIGFLDDEKVSSILSKKYHIEMDYRKMGSLDMARESVSDKDFIFPSSSLAAELYKLNGGSAQRSEDVFISPLVIYSWDTVTDGLISAGVVSESNGVYSIDMQKLVELMRADTSWADIGVNDLYGQICVYSTDPVHSNSGNLYTALIATVLNNGNTVRKNDIPDIIEPLNDILSKSGYKETSSSDLFSQYLRTGAGGKALVALYENQIIEFAAENPADWNKIKDKIRVLYPTPTVWSNHVFIAVSEEATGFFEAMNDKEIQRLVWEAHGFRIDTTAELTPLMKSIGITEEITRVIQIPDYDTMNEIMIYLE